MEEATWEKEEGGRKTEEERTMKNEKGEGREKRDEGRWKMREEAKMKKEKGRRNNAE